MNSIILIASVIALGAYVCRLDALSWREHRPLVVLVHLAGGIGCLWSGYRAFEHESGMLDAVVLGTAIAWLWISFHTWRAGPPWWAHKLSVRTSQLRQSPAASSAKTAPGRSARHPA